MDLSQRFKQVRKVSIRISRGSDSLVYLHEMHCFPRHVFIGQSPKHEPGCMPAAYSHDEPATRCDCLSGFSGDKDGSRLSSRFCVVVYFKIHANHSLKQPRQLFAR
jgi:hypothetical protein